MAFGKKKLLLSFALFGFLVGVAAYFVFDWIIINSAFGILYIPVPVFAPWFMSGIAGSVLAVISIYLTAHVSTQK